MTKSDKNDKIDKQVILSNHTQYTLDKGLLTYVLDKAEQSVFTAEEVHKLVSDEQKRKV